MQQTGSNQFKPTTVGVLICCKNSAETLEKCLEAVAKQNPNEILIVDGESNDDTLKIAKRFTDKIYSDGGKGLGYARRLGVSNAHSDFLCIVSPDDLLDNHFLHHALREISGDQKTAALLSPKRLQTVKTVWDRGQNSIYLLTRRFPIRVVGNPSIYRTSALKDYQYDPSFSANEDTDLCERWARAGLKVGWGKAFFTLECESRNFREFKNRYMWYGAGDFRFVRKWLGIDSPVAIRHLFHPLKNYMLKYPFYLLLRCDIEGAIVSISAGFFRYLGLAREGYRTLNGGVR